MKKYIIILLLILCATNAYCGEYKAIYSGKCPISGVGAYSENRVIAYIESQDIKDGNIKSVTSYIIETKDAGITWDTLKTHFRDLSKPEEKAFNKIYVFRYFDEKIIVGTGDNNMVLRTSDGGKTWDSLTIGDVTISGGYMDVIDSKNACIRRIDGNNYRSTDAGKTWFLFISDPTTKNMTLDNTCKTPKNTELYFYIDGVYGSDGFDYFNSKINRSKDLGVTWEHCDTVPDLLRKAYFINDSVAIAVGFKIFFVGSSFPQDSVNKRPVVYRTTDTGKTWKKIFEAPYCWGVMTREVYYNPNTNTFVVGLKSGYMKSKDGGFTWKFYSNNPTKAEDKKYNGSEYSYIVGENKIVNFTQSFIWLYTETSDDVKEAEQEVSESFPNPVSSNSVFNLNAEIPDGAYTAKLYDYMGGVLESASVNFASGKAIYSLGAVSPGAYILALNYDGGTIRFKVAVR